MKAKVVIEDGETQIVLTAENEFERDIIERSDKGWEVTKTNIQYDQGENSWNRDKKNHRIEINIGIPSPPEIKPEPACVFFPEIKL